MENKAVTVVTEEPKEEKKSRLTDLSVVEPIVREYAKVVAPKHGIRPEHFTLHLTSKIDAIMAVTGGHVVDIYLKWPDAQPIINMLLNDAFRLMRKYPVRRTMEIVPVAYLRTMKSDIKKMWKREKFTDESDIVLDLIPRHRLRVTKIETTIVHDVVTGEKLTLQHEYPTDRFDDHATGLWLQLSRIVRDKHPEEELPDEDDGGSIELPAEDLEMGRDDFIMLDETDPEMIEEHRRLMRGADEG